jgi:hypothetical protein
MDLDTLALQHFCIGNVAVTQLSNLASSRPIDTAIWHQLNQFFFSLLAMLTFG